MERISNWIPKEPVSRMPEIVTPRSSYTCGYYAIRDSSGAAKIFTRWRFGTSYENSWPKDWPDEVSDAFLAEEGWPVVKR